MAYLRRQRLDLATSLLLRMRRPMAEVCDLIGWPDANYITRRFLVQFGVSPTDCRRRFGGICAQANGDSPGTSHPLRYVRLMKWPASSEFLNLRFAGSHSSVVWGKRTATLPSRTVSVRGPE